MVHMLCASSSLIVVCVGGCICPISHIDKCAQGFEPATFFPFTARLRTCVFVCDWSGGGVPGSRLARLGSLGEEGLRNRHASLLSKSTLYTQGPYSKTGEKR